MHGKGDIPTQGPRRGGGASVTLFVAAALGAAVIVATRLLLAPVDTIAAFVPANAMFYAHADGRVASEAVLATSPDMPSGVRPDEVAVFIVPGDDAPRRGAMLAWRWPSRPSDDERAALAARGADMLDERHYLIHDGSLDTASRVAMAAHAAFADDRDRSSALALLRSAFPVQIYASPADILPTPAQDVLAQLPEGRLDRIVAGVTVHDGRFMARMMPLETAVARSSWLGYRASPSSIARPSTRLLDADVAASEASPSFDVARLLLGSDATVGNPDPSALAAAAEDVRTALASPYALWLRTGGERPVFLAWFPNVTVADAGRAVGGLFAAAHPSQTRFEMPDGDAAVEYRVERRAPAQGGTDIVAGEGPERVLIGPDGAKGAIIASDPSLADAFRSGREPMTGHAACPTGVLSSMVSIKEPSLVLAKWPSIAHYAAAYKVRDLVLGFTVDNEVLFCGYTGGDVDNSGK